MKKLAALLLVLLPALAFAGSGWELLQSKGEVEVYKRQLASDKEPEIKGVGNLPASPDKALGLITDIPRYAKLLDHIKTAEVLKSGAEEAVVYFYFDFPWPTDDRDYVAHYKWKKVGDGYLIEWTDANYWRPLVPKGVARIKKIRGSWTLNPNADGTTRGTYLFLAEYGGDLPQWVKEEAWTGEPTELFKALRKALK
jgi:hypothetical protein